MTAQPLVPWTMGRILMVCLVALISVPAQLAPVQCGRTSKEVRPHRRWMGHWLHSGQSALPCAGVRQQVAMMRTTEGGRGRSEPVRETALRRLGDYRYMR